MPRKYKSQLGARSYKNYTQESLDNALTEITTGKLSYRQAAQKYGIHKNTLFGKMHKKNPKNAGGQTVLSNAEEVSMVGHILAMANYGFPLTAFDIRCIVKAYLDRIGRKVKCFKNNLPGAEWVRFFLKRHKNLTQRIAKNITHSRAANDEEILNNFFSHLGDELRDILSTNIWNYDETNLVDDPGSIRVITKRGTKYPERIRNSSKACTSIMVCGNAAGQLAPIYVNYKAEKLWSTWTENGPQDARYNRTKSGWFDSQSFEDWFISLMLPILKKQIGVKVLIGDNLSSHLNIEVLRQCEQNNIKFIALPPNATHLLQPLDVAFFRPMKIAWRKILSNWKENIRASRCSSVPKDEFPSLLKKLLAELSEKSSDNLKAGFRKTGIFPLDKDQPMDRLPNRLVNRESTIKETVTEVFLGHLNESRATVTKTTERKKRKLLNVPAGKSIGSSDLKPPEDSKENQQPINTANSQSEFRILRGTKRRFEEFENDSNSSAFSLRDSSDSELNLPDVLSDISTASETNFIEEVMQKETQNEMLGETENENQIETEIENEKQMASEKSKQAETENEMQMQTEKVSVTENMFVEDFIVVEFMSRLGKKEIRKYFIGKIIERLETDHLPQFYCKFLRALKPKEKIFHYPAVDDLCIIDYSQVKAVLKLKKEHRGKYHFVELPNYDIS